NGICPRAPWTKLNRGTPKNFPVTSGGRRSHKNGRKSGITMTSRKPRGSGNRSRTPKSGRRGGPFSGADYDRNLGPVDRSQYRKKGQGQGKKSRQHVPQGERLQKVIAAAGIASRRVAEDLISEGRVEVNHDIVTALGTRVDPDSDIIFVDGIRVNTKPEAVYYAFNKPRGVISTMSDPKGRPSIADFVDSTDTRLFHVGRLDNETEGLLLLTNHGDLANRLSHPLYEVPKKYLVQGKGPMRRGVGEELRAGIELEEDGLVSVD